MESPADIDRKLEELATLRLRVDDLEAGLEELGDAVKPSPPEGAAGESNGDQQRLDRGLRNLAFELEQRYSSVEGELAAVRAHLQEIDAKVDEPAVAHEPLAGQPPDPHAELEGLRRQVGALRRTVAQEGAVEGELADLKALRRQVAELQRSVAEVQRIGLIREGRRGRLTRVLGASFRAVTSPFRRRSPAPGREGTSQSRRRPVRIRVRRARLRALRVARGTKARIRNRLFARRIGRLQHHDPKELKIPRRYRRQVKLDDPPVISMVTPSFNQGHFLGRTIRSVVEQDYPRLEYIVQDGGSTDDTEQVLARHAPRLHHYEMRDDDGHAHAINLGFEHSSGEIMAFLNSDDLLLPGSLRYVARYFERHPEVDVVYGHRVLVDEKDMEIGRWVLPRHDDDVLSWADFVPQETLFWRRRIWERAGGYMDQDWPFALDWDLLIRLRDAGANTVRLPRFLGAFRIHEAQKTSAIMDTQGQAEAAALRKRIHGREGTRPEITAAVKPYMRRHLVLQKLYRGRVFRY